MNLEADLVANAKRLLLPALARSARCPFEPPGRYTQRPNFLRNLGSDFGQYLNEEANQRRPKRERK